MKKLETVDPSKMLRNPFSVGLKIEVSKITDTKRYRPDAEGIMYPVDYLIEKERMTKIYHFAGAKDMVYNLSPSAKCLYLFVLYNIEVGEDYIRLNTERYMQKNRVKSINTYKKAVKELIRYCFLSQSADYKEVYWINPMLFFSGSRVNKYPESVVIKNEL